MISARIVRNGGDGNIGMPSSKTPAGKTPGRRVAFGDISNRKPPPGQASAIKKTAGPLSKTVRRVVDFKIPSDEIELKNTKRKSDDEDEYDISVDDISRFQFKESHTAGVHFDDDDWKELLAEEKKELEDDKFFAELRQQKYDKKSRRALSV